MSIIARIKRVTPKQWALIAGVGGAAGLGIDYFRRREGSLVGQLLHKLHPGHGGGGGGGGGGAPPPRAPRPSPMPAQLPMSAMYAEPAYGQMPPDVWAPVYGGVPYFARYFPSPHGYVEHARGHGGGEGHEGGHGGGGGGHHAGAPGPTDGVKRNVPPPGSRGIVAVTPPAPTDPGAQGTSTDGAPCGAGLYYDAASGRCMPYPTTPPYGWE